MNVRPSEDEPDLGTLVAMVREGKLSRDTLDELLTKRQMPLFGASRRRFEPLFTPHAQEQLCLFPTDDRQRQLTLSLVTEVGAATVADADHHS